MSDDKRVSLEPDDPVTIIGIDEPVPFWESSMVWICRKLIYACDDWLIAHGYTSMPQREGQLDDGSPGGHFQ